MNSSLRFVLIVLGITSLLCLAGWYFAPIFPEKPTYSLQPLDEMPTQYVQEPVPSSSEFLGTYHDSAAYEGRKSFTLPAVGISFTYPADLLLFSHDYQTKGVEQYAITIFKDTPYLRDLMDGKGLGGEGPPGITMSFYRLTNQSTSLSDWLRENTAYSNFRPTDQTSSAVLTPTTVAGLPAYTYKSDGLYLFNHVAWMYRDWVIIASDAHESHDSDMTDFYSVLSSVRFVAAE